MTADVRLAEERAEAAEVKAHRLTEQVNELTTLLMESQSTVRDITAHVQGLDLTNRLLLPRGATGKDEVEGQKQLDGLKAALRNGVIQGLRRGRATASPYKKARAVFASPEDSGESMPIRLSPEQIQERLNRRMHAEEHAESAVSRLESAGGAGAGAPPGAVWTSKRGAKVHMAAPE